MILSNFIGAVLPMILTKIKLDPALISSPLLAAIVDSSGLLIYSAQPGLFLVYKTPGFLI